MPDAFILKPNGRQVPVKNLGWLLKNWKEVKSFELHSKGLIDGYMIAHLRDGGSYHSAWNSKSIMLDWIKRPVFYGLPYSLDGRAMGEITK